MRGLGLSQTPEMKTETKRVFSPFVDVDNMKSGAYKERISKTDYKELGNKKNEVEVWKPNHELGESGELKQGSLYGNVSANGVVNQGGSVRPLLVDKQNPNYEEDKKNYLKTIEAIKNGTFKTGSRIKVLSKTPIIWQQYGLPNKRFLMKKETFKKASNIPNRKKVNHDVGDDVLNNLPDLLQKPEYILKSSTEKNSFVGVLNANDKQGYPIVVAVKPIQDGLQVNLIQSVYGRKNFNNWITKQADNILYKKATSSPTTLSLENNLGQGDKDVTNNIITDNSETFKGGVEKDKYIGKKFFVGDKEEEIIGYDDNHKMYVGKPAYDWGGNNLYTKEHLDKYYLPENYNFEEDKARREKEKQENERILTEKKIQKENEEKEYNDIKGYADDKTPLQRGKILKTLNKRVWYKKINNGQPTTSKKAIEEMVEEGFKPKKETFYKTFKRNGERFEKEENKLVMMNEQGEFYKVNLTEFYYAKHLVNKENTIPLENSEKINNNDSNNEQSREISRNEYTQETSTNKRTDVTEELEKQEKINWERTLKRRDNVDIEIIKRAANLKNGKKYSTGEIKMLIGSARRGTLNTPSLRSRFDKLMKLVEEPDDRITVQGGLSEFAEFHNPNATDEELVNEAINNLLHNRKPLNITEKTNDYNKHLEQMYNDIENVRTQLLNAKTDVEAFEIYEQKANELIKKYPNEISDDTFVEFVNIINDKYEQSSYNKENEGINEYISNVNGSSQGIYEKTSERNERGTRKSNDDNIERVSKNDGNEYTQETSTNRRTDVTEELETKSNKYEDYGEKISGAKKDLWSSYKDKLSEKISNSADEITLSKAFPEPNYESLLKSGIDKNLLATIKAIRDSIPDKPRSKYQVSRKEDWVNAVKVSRAFVNKLISGEVSLDEFDNGIKTSSLKDKIDLYRKIGYPSFNNVKDYSIEFSNGYYIKDGKRLDKPTSLYGLYKKTGKRTKHLINTFDTKEQAIERLKQELSNIDNTPKKKDVPLSVWKWQGEKSINGWCIGKKIGTGKYVDLKTGFKTHTEAREYLNAHKDELVEQLNKLKEEPQTRGLTNRDRIGKEYREGNVTPEQLANTFGFRGVQFGNYVEGNKRISDVNRCFDAFADLANVLNIPEKAVSLNGELGIAFGARGNGGKNSAAAHYEPNQVVINLTKKNGAGCLAHEWWHALDNYFGKMNDSEFVTETYAKRTENIRQEMVDAFKNISKVVRESLYERSKNVDKYRSKDYWSTTREMTARAFEKYIIAKAKEQGITNDYLANILGDSVVDNETSTYPLKAEMDGIIKAYDNFFDKVKTKETDKGVALYSRTNEPQSKSSKITSNDVANIISAGKTIGEMVETSPVLSVLKDEIAGLEDYTIAPMTDKEKGNGLRGIHYRDTKLITLNMEAINDKYEVVEVLAHELQHAKQGQEYHKIVNEYGLNKEDIKNLDRIANAELYKKDSVPAQVVVKHLKNKIRRKGLNSNELEKLINYHKCGIVNTKMNDCYNVNPELMDKLLNETGKLSNKKEIKRYIIDNYGRKSYNTFADYVRAYNNYLDDINETDANVFGSKIRKKQERIENERLFSKTMGFNEEIRTVGNVRTGYRDGFEKSQGNVEKLDERREGKTQFNTNRTISNAQRGIADDTSIDDVYNTDFLKNDEPAVIDKGQDLDLEPIFNALNIGVKGSDFIKLLPKEIADKMQNMEHLQNYKFVKMSNGYDKLSINGQHIKVFKQIILNIDAIGNNPNKFINTLMHEVEHANQEATYKEIKSKPRKDWTVEDREFVAHYNICYRVNKERRIFYNKHKDLIDKFRNNNFSSKEERTKAIFQLDETKRNIILTSDKNYENYKNALFEVQAREQGVKYAKKYRTESRISRLPKTKQDDIRGYKKWNLGPNTRNSSTRGGKLSTNKRGLGQNQGRNTQFLGEYSEEQPEYRTEPTRQEINKATTLSNSDSAVQRIAKNEVRKWYGGIEKDRYDVNKNTVFYINLYLLYSFVHLLQLFKMAKYRHFMTYLKY